MGWLSTLALKLQFVTDLNAWFVLHLSVCEDYVLKYWDFPPQPLANDGLAFFQLVITSYSTVILALLETGLIRSLHGTKDIFIFLTFMDLI